MNETNRSEPLEVSHTLPAASLPTEGLTFSKLVLDKGRQRCIDNQTSIFNVETNERWKFSYIHEKADLLAKGLLSLGVSRGDRLVNSGVVSNTGALLFTAGISIGLGFSHQYVFEPKMTFVTKTLSVIAPRVLVLGEGMNGEDFDFFVELFDPNSETPKCDLFPSIEFVFYDNSYKDRKPKHKFLKPVSVLLEAGKKITDGQLTEAKNKIEPNDVMKCVFTSGSTGMQKCVAYTQQMMGLTGLGTLNMFDMKALTSALNVDEIMGYSMMQTGLLGGCDVVLLPDLKSQKLVDPNLPKLIADTINEEKIDFLAMSIRYVSLLLDYTKTFEVKLPTLSAVLCTTQVLSKDFRSKVANHLGAKPWVIYGMSELNPIGMSPIDDSLESQNFRLVGKMKALPYMEVKLMTESGQIAKIGEEGELFAKGPVMNIQYANNPEATKALFSEDGFLMTGDVGIMDEQGYFTIYGRISEADRLKVFGKIVYPGPIEESMADHPSIKEVAVISGQQADWRGAEVVYCIALEQGAAEPSEEEILSTCKNSGLQERQWPARLFYFTFFPTTDNIRKVSKLRLRAEILARIEKDEQAGMTEWYKELYKTFTKPN